MGSRLNKNFVAFSYLVKTEKIKGKMESLTGTDLLEWEQGRRLLKGTLERAFLKNKQRYPTFSHNFRTKEEKKNNWNMDYNLRQSPSGTSSSNSVITLPTQHMPCWNFPWSRIILGYEKLMDKNLHFQKPNVSWQILLNNWKH